MIFLLILEYWLEQLHDLVIGNWRIFTSLTLKFCELYNLLLLKISDKVCIFSTEQLLCVFLDSSQQAVL